MSEIFSIALLESAPKETAAALVFGGELLLLISFVAVVVGLIGKPKAKKWMPVPRKVERWHHGFVLLVIVGVAGGLIADGVIFLASHRLQAIDDLTIERLKAQTAWRRLTKPEHDAIVAFAKADGRHLLRCDNTPDPETGPYADDICEAFGDGGWTTSRGIGVWRGTSPTGMQVYPGTDGLDEAVGFARQLSDAVNVQVTIITNAKSQTLALIVGSRPRAR